MKSKPKIMISFREGGENGGPFVSHKRIMESKLKEVYDFVPLIVPKGHLGILNIKVIKKIIKDIKINKPDIVQFTGLQLEGFHVALACKLVGIKKSIVAVHGSSNEAINLPYLKRKVLTILEGFTLKITNTSYGVSEYVSNWDIIKKKSKKYFGHIYNMPFDQKFPIDSLTSIRKELNIGDDEIIITSTGRITEEKGYAILCDVIKNLSTFKKVRYIIAGEGLYLNDLKIKLNQEILLEKVFLLGYRSDINKILSESNIFVICTYHETLCLSLIEAAQNGLALVATNVGGIPEIVINNYNGYLTKPNDVESVIIALMDLIENDTKRKELGENAKLTIDNKFSELSIIYQLDKLYRSLLYGKN